MPGLSPSDFNFAVVSGTTTVSFDSNETTYTATGANASNNVFSDVELNDGNVIAVLGTMSDTTGTAAASVTSFGFTSLDAVRFRSSLDPEQFFRDLGGTLETSDHFRQQCLCQRHAGRYL